MSTYFTTLNTREGFVHVLTKSRWLGLFPMPRTSITPHHAADLKQSGTLIKWTARDATTLAALHDAVVQLVQRSGLSGLVEIANSVKMTERVASAVGEDWHDVVKRASQGGVSFPVPDDILRYIKSFI